MKVRPALSRTLALAAICFIADSAMAKRIPIKGHSQQDVQSTCGGIYLPKNRPNGTYGCVNDDGSGIICGGVKPKHQRTCDTFRVRSGDQGPLAERLNTASQ